MGWNFTASCWNLQTKLFLVQNYKISCSKIGPKMRKWLFYVSVCVTKQAEPSVTRILIEIKCLVIDSFENKLFYVWLKHALDASLFRNSSRVNFEFYSFIFFVCIFFWLVIWKLCSPFLESFRNLFWTPPILTQSECNPHINLKTNLIMMVEQ